MTVLEFEKLKDSQKEELIHSKAMLLESYSEKGNQVTHYYIPGLFIKVSTSLKEKSAKEIIPFRGGPKSEKEKDALYRDFFNKHLLVA
jgi:hypothetical protein